MEKKVMCSTNDSGTVACICKKRKRERENLDIDIISFKKLSQKGLYA